MKFFKDLCYRDLFRLLIILATVFILTGVIGFVNLAKLGLTPSEYDMSHDAYYSVLSGSKPATSGNAFIDACMSGCIQSLSGGIILLVIGIVGSAYFTKHPEKDKKGAKKLKKPDIHSVQDVQRLAKNVARNASPTARNMISVKGETGIRKAAIILSLFSIICFILGISIFPYALLSIISGIALLLVLRKCRNIKSWWAVIPLTLFMARFFVTNEDYSGYDWITVLYRVLGYASILLVTALNWGHVFIVSSLIEFEDDDYHLVANLTVLLGLINTVLVSIEFFRSFSNGFGVIVFRLGSISFWLAFALHYIYAKRPKLPSRQEIYGTNQKHPYYQIGGSVLIFMIAIYLLAGGCFAGGPLLFTYYRSLLLRMAGTGTAGAITSILFAQLTFFIMLAASAVIVLAGVFLLWLNRKLRYRSPRFLQYYEFTCIILVLLSLFVIFGGNVWIGLILLLCVLAGSYFSLRWLYTSVRLRTYMGNDKYLRNGLFTNRFKAPVPVRTTDMGSWTDEEEEWEEIDDVEEWEEVDEYDLMDEYEEPKPESRPKHAKTTPTVSRPKQSAKRYNPNRCCICGRGLDDGYAVLLTSPDGDEARIDQPCYNAIETLAQGEDKYQVRRAIANMKSYLELTDPAVQQRLRGYIQSATDYVDGRS